MSIEKGEPVVTRTIVVLDDDWGRCEVKLPYAAIVPAVYWLIRRLSPYIPACEAAMWSRPYIYPDGSQQSVDCLVAKARCVINNSKRRDRGYKKYTEWILYACRCRDSVRRLNDEDTDSA